MNEILIGNAIKFLSDSSVRTSSTEKQLNFLRGKGLNDDEIEEAYRRAGLSSPLSGVSNNPIYNSTSSSSNYPAFNGNSSYNSYPYEGQSQDHIFQLARNSTTARWLLLVAVVASTLTFLAKHIPNTLYRRMFNWLQRIFTGGNSIGKDHNEEKIFELVKKIERIQGLIEGLSKRNNELESQMIAWRYYQNHYTNQNEYDDCLEEEEENKKLHAGYI